MRTHVGNVLLWAQFCMYLLASGKQFLMTGLLAAPVQGISAQLLPFGSNRMSDQNVSSKDSGEMMLYRAKQCQVPGAVMIPLPVICHAGFTAGNLAVCDGICRVTPATVSSAALGDITILQD